MKNLLLALILTFSLSACSATGMCSSCSEKKDCAHDGKPCSCEEGKTSECKMKEAAKSCH